MKRTWDQMCEMLEKQVKEIEFWQERAKKLADDKIRLRNLLDEEIKKDIDEVLKRNREKE